MVAVPVTVKQTDSNVVVLSGGTMVLYRRPLQMMARHLHGSPSLQLWSVVEHQGRRSLAECNVEVQRLHWLCVRFSVRRKTSYASSSIVLPIVVDSLLADLAFSKPNFTERRRPCRTVGPCLADGSCTTVRLCTAVGLCTTGGL